MLDVAIVGGGPGGLAFAHASGRIFKDDAQLKVFEKAMQYEQQGATVVLHPNGVNAVHALDPALLERLRAKASRLDGTQVIMDKSGKVVKTIKDATFEQRAVEFGVKPFVLGWHEIRAELYSILPSGTVEFNSQVVRVTDCGDHAELVIRKGDAGEEEVVRARVVVGADGYYSRIREYCLNDGPPNFGDKVIWRARIPMQEGLPITEAHWYKDGETLMSSNRLFLTVPCSASTVVWTANVHVSYLSSIGMDYDPVARAVRDTSLQDHHVKEDLIEKVLKVYEDFDPVVHDVVMNTPPECITEHGVFQRDPETLPSVWGKGPITLMGDAAHLTRPTGQGCNLAFEDAVVLAQHIQKYGFNSKALRTYEADRTPRVKKMMKFVDFGHTQEEVQAAFGFRFEPLQEGKHAELLLDAA